MPLETATYISDLVTSNPAASDGMNNADDHMRLIKAALQATLPGAAGPVLTAAGGHLSRTDGSAVLPAFAFANEPTLGFWRSASGVISVVGGRMRNAAPLGSIHMFVAQPASFGNGSIGGTGHEFLELDGSTWNTADFPLLANHLGFAGSTFTVPNLKSLGLFPRSRTAGIAAGTAQAADTASHTHTATFAGFTLPSHTHTAAGTTGDDSPDHTHTVANIAALAGPNNNNGGGGGAFSAMGAATTFTSAGASARHQHAFSVSTSGPSTNLTPTGTVTVTSTGGAETRPVNMSFIFAIKT